MIYLFELLFSVFLPGAAAFFMALTNRDNLARAEKLCRNRLAGIIMGFPCALLCVPLAEPVSPAMISNLLLPIAVALPILCWFFIDYYAARSFSFALILAAYETIHISFEHRIYGSQIITVIMLIMGTVGIFLAAKPCMLRDIFRKTADSAYWKYCAVCLTGIFGAAALYTLIMTVRVYVK